MFTVSLTANAVHKLTKSVYLPRNIQTEVKKFETIVIDKNVKSLVFVLHAVRRDKHRVIEFLTDVCLKNY